MSTNFKYSCPHCLTQKANFVSAYQWNNSAPTQTTRVFAICNVCHEGLILWIYFRSHNTPDFIGSNLNIPDNNVFVARTWPSVEMDIPNHIPDNIERYYTQGLQSLKGQQWDAASAMFRKTLESATKKLKPDYIQDTLFSRIQKMQEDGSLTRAMGDWSHEIRLDGNAAVHDEEPETKEDAEIIQLFTEAFLKYAYSLPQMVEQNRQKRLASRT